MENEVKKELKDFILFLIKETKKTSTSKGQIFILQEGQIGAIYDQLYEKYYTEREVSDNLARWLEEVLSCFESKGILEKRFDYGIWPEYLITG